MITVVRRAAARATVGVAAAACVAACSSSGSGSSAPSSPRAAAQAWINAHLAHNDALLKSLSCAGGEAKADSFDLVVASAASVTAGAATSHGAGTWTVPLVPHGPAAGGTQFPVTVRKTAAGYRVC